MKKQNNTSVSRRGFVAGTTALAGSLGFPAIVGAQPAAIKVGLIHPVTGFVAYNGQQGRLGGTMAIEDINKAGGIKSMGGAKLELVAIDAGDSAEKAKNAAQRLVAQEPEVVGGMGAWLSTFTLAVTEVTERAEIPWLTLSYADSITDRGFKFVYQSSPTAGWQSVNALPTILELGKAAAAEMSVAFFR